MLVKFIKPWKDFEEGEEVQIEEGIAEGLIIGGIVKNIGFDSARDKDSTITGLPYKKAHLNRVKTEITVLTRKLQLLKDKEKALTEEIEKLEEEKAEVKAVKSPPQDKMFRRRGSITKEVTTNA